MRRALLTIPVLLLLVACDEGDWHEQRRRAVAMYQTTQTRMIEECRALGGFPRTDFVRKEIPYGALGTVGDVTVLLDCTLPGTTPKSIPVEKK